MKKLQKILSFLFNFWKKHSGHTYRDRHCLHHFTSTYLYAMTARHVWSKAKGRKYFFPVFDKFDSFGGKIFQNLKFTQNFSHIKPCRFTRAISFVRFDVPHDLGAKFEQFTAGKLLFLFP